MSNGSIRPCKSAELHHNWKYVRTQKQAFEKRNGGREFATTATGWEGASIRKQGSSANSNWWRILETSVI